MGQLAMRPVDVFELGGDSQDLGLLVRGEGVHRRAGDLLDQAATVVGGGALAPSPHPRRVHLQHAADAPQRPSLGASMVDHVQQLALDVGVDPRGNGAAC